MFAFCFVHMINKANETVSAEDTAVSLQTRGGGWCSWLLETESAKSWPNLLLWTKSNPKSQPLWEFSFPGGWGILDTTVLKYLRGIYLQQKKICTTCVESNEHLVITLCNTRDVTPQQLLSSWQAVRCVFTWTDICGLSNKTFFCRVICPNQCRIYCDNFRTPPPPAPPPAQFLHFPRWEMRTPFWLIRE